MIPTMSGKQALTSVGPGFHVDQIRVKNPKVGSLYALYSSSAITANKSPESKNYNAAKRLAEGIWLRLGLGQRRGHLCLFIERLMFGPEAAERRGLGVKLEKTGQYK